MSFIPEESKKERELRQKVEAAFGKDPNAPSSLKSRTQKRKEKEEARRKDYEQKQKTLEYKRERLEWQKERSKIKDKERQEAAKRRAERKPESSPSNINMETISDKDRDPTAYKKAIGGVASFGKAVVGAGAKAVISAAKRRKERKQQEKQEASQRASQAQRERTQSAMSQSSRLLPGNIQGETQGQRARRDPNFKKREILKRGGTTSEEFSCWREEFIYELKDIRKKKKLRDGQDYIVDVMKGKNKITIGPVIKEQAINEKINVSSLKKGAKKAMMKVEAPLFATAFGLSALQSPQAFVRSGHIEAPGTQLMSTMMRKRKEADRNLDSGRVSHPARNKKIKEEISKEDLLKLIVKKLVDEKKRKNSLIINKYIGEGTAAWTRKEGKSPTGGLNKRGVASYRRENPGSNLQTAVTTPPSKLNPNSKAAKRRKSFCARMSGVEGPMKDEKGRPTRKALALRKWNC